LHSATSASFKTIPLDDANNQNDQWRQNTPPPGLERAETVLLTRFARCAGVRLVGSSPAEGAFVAHGPVATLPVEFATEHAAARTRTWGNLVNSEVLYHLSYGGSHLRIDAVCP
jgi:hypothetical protein